MVSPFQDDTAEWSPKIAPYLQPGEPILAFGITGGDPNWKIRGGKDNRGAFMKTIDAIFFASWPHTLAMRLWHGRTHYAPEGSTAYSYLMAHQRATHKPGKWLPASVTFPTVLTDRRFARYGSEILRDRITEEAWSCPRRVIARAEVKIRGLSFGRLKLTFIDGSWVLLSDVPDFGRRRAKRFAEVLNGAVRR